MEKVKTEAFSNQIQRCTALPTGKYNVSCSDILLGHGVEGTLFRLFYPADLNDANDLEKAWIPWDLGREYTKISTQMLCPGSLQILSASLGNIVRKLQKNCKIPITWESPLANGKFPLVMFSHGFGGNRSIHAGLCSDIASHGFLVAAIEHRDKTATATYYIEEDDRKVWILHDLLSTKIKEKEKTKFWKRIPDRAREICRLLSKLEAINDDNSTEKNLLTSNFDVRSLKNKIDFRNVVMSGYSLGGMTAIVAICMDSRFRCGVNFDPYITDILHLDEAHDYLDREEVEYLKELLKRAKEQPMLYVLNDSFHDKESEQAFRTIFNKEKSSLWTLLKSNHLNHTDVPMLFKDDPEYIRRLLGSISRIPPELHHKLSMNLTLSFIDKHLERNLSTEMKYDKNYIEENNQWIKNEFVATSPSRTPETYAIRVAVPKPDFVTTPRKFLQAVFTVYRNW